MCLIFGSIEPIGIFRCVSGAPILRFTLGTLAGCFTTEYLFQVETDIPIWHSVGPGWQPETASQSLQAGLALLVLYQDFSSTGTACVGFPDSLWPGAVTAEGNHQGAIEDCCLALRAREPGTHSGFGTFQNVSSVRFLRLKGMWRQEKKSAEGRSWCR